MFVSGAFVLTDTLGRSFDNLFTNIYAHTDVQVTAKPALDTRSGDLGGPGSTGEIKPADITRIAAIPGVASATGSVSVDNARVVGADGKTVPSQGPPRLGEAWHG